MKLPDLDAIEQAGQVVYEVLQPSPQLCWPLLSERCGGQVWVKHENHNPTGSFKVRGGLVYMQRLASRLPAVAGVCAATRGNHGQSVAFAAAKYGLTATIVVPHGNSQDKNAAMRAYGAELIEQGADFDEALQHCKQLAEEGALHFMPSIDEILVHGVATCALEFLRAAPRLDRLYVPVGIGSGICGAIAARNALGLKTEIIGVVAANANTYQHSFAAGQAVPTNSADTIADGLAVRNPAEEVLAILRDEVQRIVAVSEQEILQAIGVYYDTTHNVAEGAAAAALAALLKDAKGDAREGVQNGVSGLMLTGGNISRALFRQAIGG